MSGQSSRLLAVTTALCLLAGAARAQDIHIAYTGLDLHRTTDAATFKDRVNTAATAFCNGYYSQTTDLVARRNCKAAFWDEVRDQLPPDQVAALDGASLAGSAEVAARR